MADAFQVITVHGEGETIYQVVDTAAPEAEQPAVTVSYSTASYANAARSCAEYAAEVLNGRGYKGEPNYIEAAYCAVLARCKTS